MQTTGNAQEQRDQIRTKSKKIGRKEYREGKDDPKPTTSSSVIMEVVLWHGHEWLPEVFKAENMLNLMSMFNTKMKTKTHKQAADKSSCGKVPEKQLEGTNC